MAKSAFEKIAEGLTDAIAYTQGDKARGRVGVTVDVKSIRARTGLSQAAFAQKLHMSPGTLRNWEQGIRSPDGPAQTLLAMVEADPKAALDLLAKIP